LEKENKGCNFISCWDYDCGSRIEKEVIGIADLVGEVIQGKQWGHNIPRC
jgi:hypothetical protein